jgi:hypothetical protein
MRFQGQTAAIPPKTSLDVGVDEVEAVHVRCSSALPMARTIPLFKALCESLRYGPKGDIAEFGVFRGETAKEIIHIVRYLDFNKVKIHLFDTFAGLPDPHLHDLAMVPNSEEWEHWEQYYASENVVRKTLWEYEDDKDYCLHKGLVADTGKNFNTPLSFAHIDCDLYEGTRDSLEVCNRVIVPTGVVVIDDFNTEWVGVTQAVREFMETSSDFSPVYPKDPEVEPNQFIMIRKPQRE